MIARPIATIPAVALACALVLSPLRARAEGPAAAPPPAASPAAGDPDPTDLTAMREQADAAAAASPTPANHRRSAELAERAGDFAAAEKSYAAELDGLGAADAEARAKASADLKRVRERSRGAVADEGSSTHRAALDRAWAPPARPEQAKPAAPPAAPPKATADDRIVRKWYFWVTLGAIAASAAAVTAIAIKASRDDKPDALDRSGRLRLSPSGLRF